MSVVYTDTTQKMFLCRKNRKILSTSCLFSIQKVESFVNLTGEFDKNFSKKQRGAAFQQSRLVFLIHFPVAGVWR